MEWRDDAIVLSARRHGESALIAHVLTAGRGRCAGRAPGGAGRREKALWEPGNQLHCRWRARSAERLGSLSGELAQARAAGLLDKPGRLAALSAACALCDALLPERAPHPALFHALAALLDFLSAPASGDAPEDWAAAYVVWEVGLLAELGFALDLDRCAVTGAREDLRWVSPRTGRAVSAAAGAAWANRLLALPGFLIGAGAPGLRAVNDGLRLTGHFLNRHGAAGRAGLPPARDRLARRLAAREDGDGGRGWD